MPVKRSQLALMIEKVQEGVDHYNYFFFKDFGLTNKDETHGKLGDWEYTDTVTIADQTIISLHDKSNTRNSGDMDMTICIILPLNDY